MQAVLLILLFFLLLVVPGFLLYNLLLREKPKQAVFYLPISFSLGLFWISLFAISSYLLKLSWQSFNLIYALGLISLAGLVFYKRARLNLSVKLELFEKFILALALGLAIYMIFIAPAVAFTDAPFHIAQIRKLAENPQINAAEAMLPTGTAAPSYAYNSWFLVMAFLNRLTGLDTFQLWDRSAIFLVPVAVCSFYYFISKLFTNNKQTFLIVLVYLIFVMLFSNSADFRSIAYPERVARLILLTTTLGVFFEYLQQSKKLTLAVLGALALTITTVHLYSWLHLMLAVGAFGLLSFVIKNYQDFVNSFKVLATTLIIPLPYLWLKLYSYSTVSIPDAWAAATSTLKINYLFISRLGYSFILLGVLIYLFRKSFSKERWLVFLVSTSLIATFILFNPLVFPLVAKLISVPFAQRLTFMVYTEIIFGVLIFLLIKKFFQKYESKILTAGAVSIVVVATLIPFTSYKGLNVFSLQGQVSLRRDYKTPVLEFIRSNLPKGKVFAVNYALGYWLPAYDYQYLIMTYPDHTTFTVDHKPRIEALKNILDQSSSIESAIKDLNTYQAEYIILAKLELEGEDKFAQDRRFRVIYEDDLYRLYSYNP